MGSNIQKGGAYLLPMRRLWARVWSLKCGRLGRPVIAKEGGVVERVASDEITIREDSGKKTTYHLIKFKRSNQGTCINQRPIVNVGDRVEKGDIIADGPATRDGEIALGKNVLVGFMAWEGYNYEDAVLINENLVRYDTYTSIHIEEYIHDARDTQLGPEEITREIPNVSEDALKDLSPDGIVRKGTEVRAGDILVGKTTPGRNRLTTKNACCAYFSEKARCARHLAALASRRVGVVVDVRCSRAKTATSCRPGKQSVRVYVAQSAKFGRRQDGRPPRQGRHFTHLPPKTCRFLRTVRRLILCSTRWACRHDEHRSGA